MEKKARGGRRRPGTGKPPAEEGCERSLAEDLLAELDALAEGRLLAEEPEWLSTGADLLDWAIGGGWPFGKMCEVFGAESDGKSLLCILACREVQKLGGTAVYLATEPDLDPRWARTLGLDPARLLWAVPGSLEETLSLVSRAVDRSLLRPMEPLLIVWDSLAATGAAQTVQTGEGGMALEARILSAWFRGGILRRLSRTRAALLIANQVREAVGVRYGPRETTPGGRAVRHYAAVRVRVKKGKDIIPHKGAEPNGHFMEARVVKDKVASPGRKAVFPFFDAFGVDNAMSLIFHCNDKGSIPYAGGYCVFDGERLRRSELRDRMLEDQGVMDRVRELARESG